MIRESPLLAATVIAELDGNRLNAAEAERDKPPDAEVKTGKISWRNN